MSQLKPHAANPKKITTTGYDNVLQFTDKDETVV
jgi:hypothetical protein